MDPAVATVIVAGLIAIAAPLTAAIWVHGSKESQTAQQGRQIDDLFNRIDRMEGRLSSLDKSMTRNQTLLEHISKLVEELRDAQRNRTIGGDTEQSQ